MALVMKVEGITDTDCTFDGFTGWINIDGMSFGVSRATWDKQGSTERAGGNPQFGDVSISKTIDKTSPLLFQLACAGDPVTVTIQQIRSEAGSDTYEPIMELELDEALVSSLSNGVGPESVSNSESVTFNFTGIEWTFYPQKEDGTKEGQVAASYDIKQGKKAAA